MSEKDAFLEVLRLNPSDDTARLIYADWLEENDQTNKAEYLRGVSRLAIIGVDNPEGVALELRLRELGNSMNGDWVSSVGAAFGITVLEWMSGWSWELRSVLSAELSASDADQVVLTRNLPAVLVDALIPTEAVDMADSLNGRLISRFERRGPGEYMDALRTLIHTQSESGKRKAFQVISMGSFEARSLNRFSVHVLGSLRGDGALTHQNLDYLVEPLATLIGIPLADASDLLYTGRPKQLRNGLSFVEAVSEIGRLRKTIKKHHLSQSLNHVVSIEVIRSCGNVSYDVDSL